ncbi:membrane protein [mine drainage metagenome]|uniref:Membrane protein n=1 Tax=mine drainage metagenome TaxID=410659 RepID=T0ZHK2_9ZZZZ
MLAIVRSITGNTSASMGLHAGWVWVMLVVHGLSRPNIASPLSFLLSHHDGFTGWLVLAWAVVLGWGLARSTRPHARPGRRARLAARAVLQARAGRTDPPGAHRSSRSSCSCRPPKPPLLMMST